MLNTQQPSVDAILATHIPRSCFEIHEDRVIVHPQHCMFVERKLREAGHAAIRVIGFQIVA